MILTSDDQVHPDTHALTMVNNVIAVVNYVIATRPSLLNSVIADRLTDWTETARASNLPHMHTFTRGLDLDKQAVIAAVTLPFHNGRTEGVNTKTKMMSSSRGRFSPRFSQNRT